MVGHDGLVHGAGIVIQPTRDGEVDLEILLRHAEGREILHHGAQLAEAEIEHIAAPLILREKRELIRACAGRGDEAEDLIRALARHTALLREQGVHLLCADLVELVDRAQHVARALGQAEDLEKAV